MAKPFERKLLLCSASTATSWSDRGDGGMRKGLQDGGPEDGGVRKGLQDGGPEDDELPGRGPFGGGHERAVKDVYRRQVAVSILIYVIRFL